MATVLRGSDLFDTATAIGFSTNHNAATGTITIPSGLAIGTRRLIRKIHPTQGTVTINCSGETFTRANLASVELNADGDYWLLEKVTATRWELVDGWNTGENANGQWVRKASGEQSCFAQLSIGGSWTSGVELVRVWTYPIVFIGSPRVLNPEYTAPAVGNGIAVALSGAGEASANATFSVRNNSLENIGLYLERWYATGRWYV